MDESKDYATETHWQAVTLRIHNELWTILNCHLPTAVAQRRGMAPGLRGGVRADGKGEASLGRTCRGALRRHEHRPRSGEHARCEAPGAPGHGAADRGATQSLRARSREMLDTFLAPPWGRSFAKRNRRLLGQRALAHGRPLSPRTKGAVTTRCWPSRATATRQGGCEVQASQAPTQTMDCENERLDPGNNEGKGNGEDKHHMSHAGR